MVINSAALTEEEVQQAQRRRTTRALNISGTTLIVIGAIAAGGGIAGLASRAVHGTVLDTTTGSGDSQINLATADEDARRRNGYLLSGQIAFGALIAAVAILPIGITLRAIGAKRHKADGAKADGGDKPRKGRRRDKKTRARLIPGATGLTVRF
ncbi:MAG: hypothetical protein JKY37_19435 [Nannocystaceae bacterium]|nr:hypothetical protein [Nannocystaceae bacterium]